MRWSLSELRYAWKVQGPLNAKDFFLGMPKRWYRRIKLIFFWLFKGYTYETVWDLYIYFIDIFIERLKIFKKSRDIGYPAGFESEEEWDAVLERLIKGFEIMKSEELANDHLEIKSKPTYDIVQFKNFSGVAYKSNMTKEERESVLMAIKRQEEYDRETLELFIKYFRNLWD